MSDSDEASRRKLPIGWQRPALGEYDFGAEDEAEEKPYNPSRPDATRCLVGAALEKAAVADILPRATSSSALAIVVRVPSPAWVKPVEDAIEILDRTLLIFARDGSSKAVHKADVGNDEVGKHLSEGRSVMGIASSLAILPKALIVAADISIEIKAEPDILADAVSRFVGGTQAGEAVDGLASLDFHDIVSAFRAGSSAADVYARLRKTASRLSQPRGDGLPRLADAVEYGRAREWGLTLCREFEDYRFNRLAWRDLSANCVFAGETGQGKTYFARILANELGIPLIATSISEMFATSAGFLDSVVKAVRETFARAEASAPCALLLDEYDALPSRVNLDGRSSSWWTPVVAEFLLCLDSAVSGERAGLCVWAATNHVEKIDPALLRPGRLDRVIRFAAPGPDGIASILRHQLGSDLTGIDLAPLGQIGIGRSPAEIASAVKSARSAARHAQRVLEYDDLVDALAPRADMDEETLRRVGTHEAGHVVVALALDVDEVVAASIAQTSDSFGQTVMRRRGGIETRATIEDRVCANLGGRAAELVVCGDCSANASSDLATATDAMASLHVSMGLGGGLAYLGDAKAAAAMLRVDRILRDTVNADLARLQARAVDIVRTHRAALDGITAALVERRHLSGDRLLAIFRSPPTGSTMLAEVWPIGDGPAPGGRHGTRQEELP
jgi:cell division protease FtsH